jgi:hypothetical protein
MGKLIALLLVLGAGFGVYWTQFHKSPAYQAYLQWVDATVKGDCATLTKLADGKASEWVTSFCTPAGGITVFGLSTASGKSAADMVQELRASPQGYPSLRHKLMDETETADGQVTLVVMEYILSRPSNFSKPAPDHRHEVTLKLNPETSAWKILEFKDQEQP